MGSDGKLSYSGSYMTVTVGGMKYEAFFWTLLFTGTNPRHP